MGIHARTTSWQRFFAVSSLFAIIASSCFPSSASEIVLQKDSLTPGAIGAHFHGLDGGTRVGQSLISPVDGTIVGVQVWWGKAGGGAPPSQNATIRISSESYNPSFDLTTLAQINSPTMIDGVLNEFRFSDPGSNTVPISVPITAGTRFWIDVEALVDVASTDPFVMFDQAQVGAPRQYDFVKSPGGPYYVQALAIGIRNAGELAIRAIVVPVPEPSTYLLAAVGFAGIALLRRRVAR